MKYETVFESDRINFIKLSQKLVYDYLEMVNDVEVQKFISHQRKTYNLDGELKWIKSKLEENAFIFSMIEKETNELIGKKEANKAVENKIAQIIKDEKLSIEKIDLIKFGNKYFPIIEILAPQHLTLEESGNIRKSLEEKIKQEDNLINTKIIIKPKEALNAGITRSRNSTKKTRAKNNRKNNQRHKYNSQ